MKIDVDVADNWLELRHVYSTQGLDNSEHLQIVGVAFRNFLLGRRVVFVVAEQHVI